jgi:GMP reductase
MSKKFDPTVGPALGVQGAWPFEELQLQQVRLLPADNTVIESRSKVELARKFDFIHAQASMTVVPIIAANMFGVGTIQMAKIFDEKKMLVALEKHADTAGVVDFLRHHDGRTAVPSAGFAAGDFNRVMDIFHQAALDGPRSIVLDVPNGHMDKMLSTIEHYRKEFPGTILIAGNVATGSMAAKLIEAGADAVKVGIGPGSACTTKMIAGTHRPQFAAVRECAEAVHKLGGYVIADGGVKTAGDVAVAMAAGGDFVMMGGAFAAHDESGEPIYIDDKGREWQEFMGSSSAAYMTRTKGEVAHYRAAEGELQWIPHKGSIRAPGAILQEIEGGLRSAFTYVNAASTEEFARMARATYNNEDGGLNLVKAQIDVTSSSKGIPSKIVDGRANPVTGKEPRPELIQP